MRFAGDPNQLHARIGDAGHPGVGHHRHRFPAREQIGEFAKPLGFNAFVERPNGLSHLEMAQEHLGYASVFGENHVALAQTSQHAQRDVFEIAERRRTQYQPARCVGHGYSVTRAVYVSVD
jgi:hypothetical protein